MNYKILGLLLFFSVFFIVLGCRATTTATTTATATVVTATPPPNIAENQSNVKFYINPSNFYNDEFGFIGIKYHTKEEIWERRKKILEERNASPEEHRKVQNAIPKGGIISVHIGRRDLMHANTRYYTFRGNKNNRTVFAVNGREGIPNIRGRDGNWWSIVEIPLNEDIESVIDVIVTDRRTNKDYNFKIIRSE
ncbi:MAG: hypothetical protein FWC36_05010 [Spirochaetes bacterium]|nr:hypothetical protein [Spirochaetota bacterium]